MIQATKPTTYELIELGKAIIRKSGRGGYPRKPKQIEEGSDDTSECERCGSEVAAGANTSEGCNDCRRVI